MKRLNLKILLVFILIIFILSLTVATIKQNRFRGTHDFFEEYTYEENILDGTPFEKYNHMIVSKFQRPHVSLIYFLLAPIFFLFRDPIVLIIILTGVLSFSAIPLFLYAKKELKNKNLALITALIYLLSPIMVMNLVFDFHPIILAPLFIFTGMYQYSQDRKLLAAIIISGIALLQETAIIFLISLSIAMIFKDKKFAKKLAIISFIWLIILVSLVVYIESEYHEEDNRINQYLFLNKFSYIGATPVEITTNFVKNPIKYLKIDSEFKKSHLKYVYGQFLLIPLISPLIISVIPTSVMVIMSADTDGSIFKANNILVIAFMIIILLDFLKKRNKKTAKNILIIILILTMVFQILIGPIEHKLTQKEADNFAYFNILEPYKEFEAQEYQDARNYLEGIHGRTVSTTQEALIHLPRDNYLLLFKFYKSPQKTDNFLIVLSPKAKVELKELIEQKGFNKIFENNVIIVLE